ncbi:alpha/beta fold hydrolase [Soonwooa sp.]|uniref:alpha/beta hydrolase family protein n=1 Tax=Soonwooa sp. TaxID=1938592 RepID=UPI0028A726E0|nr:alpha/beta fold hydrolase [Soonwooa sp.]
MQELSIKAEDGYLLAATLFVPEIDKKKVLIINSATGVKQQMYFGFAQFLAQNGIAVITYDYRGIGLSKPKKMRGFSATMRDWGNLDYKAVTEYVIKHYSDSSKYILGHSVGALILGMNQNSDVFQKVFFVATQNAYVGHLNFKTKVSAYLGFGIMQPLSTKLFGYFPAHRFGLGESLPAGVGYDWRNLILKQKSTDYLLENSKVDISKNISKKVFVLYAEDDAWLTKNGVESLLKITYPKLESEYHLIKVKDSEVGNIGHVNFFRSYNQKLWNIILNQIN